MARQKKQLPESRFWNEKQVASRLGRSAAWLSSNLNRLRQLGFPDKDPIILAFPKEKVDSWIDKRIGVSNTASDEAEILAMLEKDAEALHGSP